MAWPGHAPGPRLLELGHPSYNFLIPALGPAESRGGWVRDSKNSQWLGPAPELLLGWNRAPPPRHLPSQSHRKNKELGRGQGAAAHRNPDHLSTVEPSLPGPRGWSPSARLPPTMPASSSASHGSCGCSWPCKSEGPRENLWMRVQNGNIAPCWKMIKNFKITSISRLLATRQEASSAPCPHRSFLSPKERKHNHGDCRSWSYVRVQGSPRTHACLSQW